MKITFEKKITQDINKSITLEWLETNGIGGWASSTIIGANTRRYHGILVAATKPPVGRMVFLSKFDETVEFHGKRFELQCNQYPGAIRPHNYRSLEKFEKELFPVFEYETEGVRIRKTIAAINGENTTVIIYEVLTAISQFSLLLQPLISARYYHNLTKANELILQDAKFKKGLLRIKPYDGFEELFIQIPNATWEKRPEWYYNFEYAAERERGLDYHEDLFSYGNFAINLNLGDKFGVVISTEDTSQKDPFHLYDDERKRRLTLSHRLPVKDKISKILVLAADQFIVQKGDHLKTIIAGYPWFTDWGRDTMIALTGLTLVTGRFEDARKILLSFTKHINQGMLPNDFPDADEEPEYNSVDATLWFFIAIYKYLHYTKDEKFIQNEILPALKDIINWHIKGTRYNIHVDKDELLYAGEPGIELTWMESKSGDKVITPREGKAVEINALWYNALLIYAELLGKFGTSSAANEFERRAEAVKRTFLKQFWSEELGYLYDFIKDDHKDASLRPNQLFALSLPYPLVSGAKAKRIFSIVTEKLYTPFGLRTLSPDDPNYHGQYVGNPSERLNAYHQGTACSWLLGPFITVMVRFYGERGRERARNIIMNFLSHINVAGVGSISEIFDGDAPHTPRGGIAQAWAVGELLRAYVEDVIGKQR